MDLLVASHKWLDTSTYANGTRTAYEHTLRTCATTCGDVEDVTEADLIRFLSNRAWAPGTITRHRAGLVSFFAWCEDEGLVGRSPAHRLAKRAAVRNSRVKTGRWLTRTEITRLLDSCDATPLGQRDRVFLTLALSTGLRRHELAGLTWGSIDQTAGTITLVGKGRKVRVVGITCQLDVLLDAWRRLSGATDSQDPTAVGTCGPNDPVLCRANYLPTDGTHQIAWGRRLQTNSINAILAHRAELAGLGRVAPHDLRRSFAGLLEDGGKDLKDIQAALGHSSPDVTVRCYLAANPKRAIQATADLQF